MGSVARRVSTAGLGGRAEFAEDTGEPDARLAGRGYQSLSAGNRLVNFTLVRGVAIMGATVSRHVA